ncbi:hypothetical protein PR202_ga21980 [Eleusine coracana subsp. coracana]|uniref:Sulfotransferase n=1 Tax=Eleusine coracana subsp. coracana TaxID=191504 RepID=A0AAV5D2P9_ELECO|nr:hypothetical protein PR202_ga21980 [Eleusine coracana subsp. coracana]
MVELNKQNKYKPWLGPGGYKKKIPIWREQEAKLCVEGKPDPLPNTNERIRDWVYGRSELTDEGEIIVKDPATVEVVQALKGPIATQTEAGLFTPQYHKDELAKAIGTKEHGGREEEGVGTVDAVVELCSIDSLKKSTTNISGIMTELGVRHGSFFRKGSLGGWRDHLTPQMAARLNAIVAQDLQGSGFTFGAVLCKDSAS